MTPPDGSNFIQDAAQPVRDLGAPEAILLRGGRALLLIEATEASPPLTGRLPDGGARWEALVWRGAAGWIGVALVDALPAAHALLAGEDGSAWRLGAASRLDVAAGPLADFVRRNGGSPGAVCRFLAAKLAAGGDGDGEARAFLQAFVTSASEQDGFVEMIAAPHTGGLMVQGWSRSLAAGARCFGQTDVHGRPLSIEIAHFDREDILPPGRGFCCFGKFWSIDGLKGVEALAFEMDDRLLRLDVLKGAAVTIGEDATSHVAQMLPRLDAAEPTLAAFRRVCRPRFAGVDTLSGADLPVAAAFDAVLAAPDGGVLVLGWLLDPLRRVERALLKGAGGRYTDLGAGWCPLPRPDLARAFGSDSRFAGLLDERDAMHGFIAYAPQPRETAADPGLYLELVLDDGSCLFRPVPATPFESSERLPQLLAALSPDDPEIGRIVDECLAPFLANVAATTRPVARAPMARPIPLGPPGPAREVAALVPCKSFAQIQPMLALLAGGPEAGALELSVVATRAAAVELLPRLEEAFDFYGLAGRLVVAPEREGGPARLDLAAAGLGQQRVLLWTPSALPMQQGWLAALTAEADALSVPGQISPALVYEDGSIHFGGVAGTPAGPCALAGYGAGWLPRGRPRRSRTGAPEIALIDRAALDRAGGFTGRLFGDAHAHIDLARRMARAGFASWCSGAVEFWILDDPVGEVAGPAASIIRRIDASLLSRDACNTNAETDR